MKLHISEDTLNELMYADVEKVFFDPARGGTMTTSSAQPPTALNLEAMERSLAGVGEEPIAAFMRAQGMPHEAGYMMVLPAKLKPEFGLFPPTYVVFSAVATSVYILPDLRPGNVLKTPRSRYGTV